MHSLNCDESGKAKYLRAIRDHLSAVSGSCHIRQNLKSRFLFQPSFDPRKYASQNQGPKNKRREVLAKEMELLGKE